MKRKNNTKEDVLFAAIDVFSEKGFTNATLEQIASRANVTRGAVYWYFKNKKEVFYELHNYLHAPLIKMFDVQIDEERPLEQLKNILKKVIEDLANDEQRQKILKVFICKCDYTEMDDILQEQKKGKKLNIFLAANFFEKAKSKNLLKSTSSSEDLSAALHCYMSGIVMEYLRIGIVDIKKDGSNFIDIFFSNIAA